MGRYLDMLGEAQGEVTSGISPEAPSQPETHGDREWRRFLVVCRPRPDGRGWYDPGTPWAVVQQLDAAGRAMVARSPDEQGQGHGG